MTLVVTILIGLGAVLIASAIDCTPIASTFQKIVNNETIDWSGTQNCTPASTSTTTPLPAGETKPATIGSGPSLVPPLSNGRCPPGYQQVTVSNGKIMCEPTA